MTIPTMPLHLALPLWRPALAAVLIAATASSAATRPDGRRLELALPPGAGDRFVSAEFSCWLPEGATPVRAVIIHQHGCTNASPDKHPPVTLDAHWRALARKHGCALLVPMYQVAGNCDEWNDPDSGSERALFTALEDFGRRLGRPELSSAPWLFWGHSGGSSWSAQMIVRHPGRVLAASFRGGCHKQFGVAEFRQRFLGVARDLPLLFVWGKRESVPPSKHHVSWGPMNLMFHDLRSAGGRVTRVIDPRSEHGCDDSRLMSLGFFDTVLSGRTEPPVYADLASLETRPANEAALRDPSLTWLPGPTFAALWREFSEQGTLHPVQPSLYAPQLQVEALPQGGGRLHWQVDPEAAGGLRALRVYRDGKLWREQGVKADAHLATSRDAPPPELLADRPMQIPAPAAGSYELSFLDAAGNESPRSTAVQLP